MKVIAREHNGPFRPFDLTITFNSEREARLFAHYLDIKLDNSSLEEQQHIINTIYRVVMDQLDRT